MENAVDASALTQKIVLLDAVRGSAIPTRYVFQGLGSCPTSLTLAFARETCRYHSR
jgi:hypothetical protein